MAQAEVTHTSTGEARCFQSMRERRESKAATGALDFVDGEYFQAFMGVVIGLNTIAIAGETDNVGWPIWPVLDNVFLCIFLVELVLRILHRGLRQFVSSEKEKWWNVLDMVIVLLGVADLWIAPFVMYATNTGEDGREQISGGSSILRFLRLLRLLRALRIFKMVRKLAAFIEAIKSMLGPFFLVITVLFGFNLFVSIVLTHILGHGEELDEAALEERHYHEVRASFCDVHTSFFSLFQIITTDNWNTIAEPVIRLSKLWRLFFVFFIAFCSWTMISILTAVASDNVISATTGRQERERLERERKTKEFYKLLRAMFLAADEDGNGLLDKEEFRALLETDQLKELLTTLEIHVKKEELYDMWDTLDVAGTGVLKLDEFVDGLAYLQEDQIMTRHIAGIDYSIRRLEVDLRRRFDTLREKISAWRIRSQILLDALQQEEQVQHQQNLALLMWLQWALRREPGSFPPELQELAEKEAEKHALGFVEQSLRMPLILKE